MAGLYHINLPPQGHAKAPPGAFVSMDSEGQSLTDQFDGREFSRRPSA
jgi:hypothetical protein